MELKSTIISKIYDNFYPWFFRFVYIRDKNRIHKAYGFPKQLSNKQRQDFNLELIDNGEKLIECGRYYPEIVYMIKQLEKIKSVILDGDSKTIIPIIQNNLRNLEFAEFTTVGLGSKKDFDFIWDFENVTPPEIPNADLIISQAMLEHLLMPFEHLRDLSKLLNKNGHLILHTQLPGYSYHRYPIDSIRFYPDFFEEAAKRLNLKVVEKYQSDFHIFYHFQK